MSRFDRLYRQLIFTGFFKKGWGDPTHIKDLLNLRLSLGDPTSAYAIQITNGLLRNVQVEIEKETRQDGVVYVDASFISPLHTIVPHLMPVECQKAKFQIMYNDKTSTPSTPLALHLAGTGDHYFYRRRVLQGSPMLKEYGVNSTFLENPFYGFRKPKDQLRSSVHYVNDIFVMGAALILESWVVLNWLKKNGLGSVFCLTGVSMGGFMASLAAGFWRESPLALVPCLAWSSAAPVYTEGVLADALPWKSLTTQFLGSTVLQELQGGISRGEYGAKYINGGCLDRPTFFAPSAVNSSHLPASTDDGLGSTLLEETLRHLPNFAPDNAAVPSSVTNNSTNTLQSRKFSTSPYSSKSQFTCWSRRGAEKGLAPKENTSSNTTGGGDAVAKGFMKNLMDQFTHLGNYSAPMDPQLTQFLVATNDAYVPSHANHNFLSRKGSKGSDARARTDDMRTVWPGCSTVELKDYGHVGAYLFKQKEYSRVIKANIEKLQTAYPSTS